MSMCIRMSVPTYLSEFVSLCMYLSMCLCVCIYVCVRVVYEYVGMFLCIKSSVCGYVYCMCVYICEKTIPLCSFLKNR